MKKEMMKERWKRIDIECDRRLEVILEETRDSATFLFGHLSRMYIL